ncbi:MAG: DUF5667 domain-containing protein, partial [Patescibacteria group bacterium]|nr:DUF5667 domain-containing protein [Patescibacteria group bacterium]
SSFLEIFRLKLIFVPVLAIFVLIGVFGFAQHSLPGDLLYSIKKATEKGQAVFVSEAEEPNFQLELANKRLEELKTIAEKNEVTKLPPAIKEVQNSASKAAKNLVKSKKVDQKTVENVLKFEKTKEEIENNILATQLGIKEEENPTKIYVEYLIEELEKRTLTEEDEEILNQMKELVEEGKYAEALELYLTK